VITASLLATAFPGLEHQVVFVSVDPEYDRPAQIAAYMNFFDPDFIGLSGSTEALSRAGRAAGDQVLRARRRARAALDRPHQLDHDRRPAGARLGAFPPPQRPERCSSSSAALRRHLAL
jgi:protein SCO1